MFATTEKRDLIKKTPLAHTKKFTFDGRKYSVATNMATVQEQSDLEELNKQVSALREMVSQRRQRKTMKEQGIFRFTGLLSPNKELPHPLRQHIQGCIRTNVEWPLKIFKNELAYY